MGAVVVDGSNRIVDTGYNGPPSGYEPLRNDLDILHMGCALWCPRGAAGGKNGVELLPGYEDCPSLHAEANALMFSDRRLRVGGTIYITSGVCGGCAKLIANSGLVRVVCDTSHVAPHRESTTWFDFMRDCGLTVDEMRH